MEVRLFGPFAAAAGADRLVVDVESAPTPDAVLRAVATASPALTPLMGHARIAVNHEYAGAMQYINEGDEVALIGLVSGG